MMPTRAGRPRPRANDGIIKHASTWVHFAMMLWKQNAIMKLIKSLISLFCLVVTAEKLEIKLEPALDFHNATGCCGNDAVFLFSVVPSTHFCQASEMSIGPPPPGGVLPPPQDNVPTEEVVCGGTFSVNLGLNDGIEFVFQAPEGKEIVMESDENNRLEFQFQATAECDIDPGDCIEVDGSGITMNVVGSNVDSLETYWNPDSSTVLAGRCEQGCSLCEIFGSFQIGGEDTTPAFTAQASTMSWSITYSPTLFHDSLNEYRYDTSGYCWIRTPFHENALVPVASIPTAAPPLNDPRPPTSATSEATCMWDTSILGLYGIILVVIPLWFF